MRRQVCAIVVCIWHISHDVAYLGLNTISYSTLVIVFNPRHLCRGVYSFRLSVRPYVCSFVRSFVLPSRSWNYFKVLRASNSSGVYLTNHSSESIHIWTIHPVIFRHEHPSILRQAFLAMYRYVNVCKCKLISRKHLRQILINNFIAVSLGKTNTCL